MPSPGYGISFVVGLRALAWRTLAGKPPLPLASWPLRGRSLAGWFRGGRWGAAPNPARGIAP